MAVAVSFCCQIACPLPHGRPPLHFDWPEGLPVLFPSPFPCIVSYSSSTLARYGSGTLDALARACPGTASPTLPIPDSPELLEGSLISRSVPCETLLDRCDPTATLDGGKGERPDSRTRTASAACVTEDVAKDARRGCATARQACVLWSSSLRPRRVTHIAGAAKASCEAGKPSASSTPSPEIR